MRRTVADVLTEARGLLASPEHWTRSHYATDEGGRPVPPASPEAWCWCPLGAVLSALGERRDTAEDKALWTACCQALQRAVTDQGTGHQTVAEFNDDPRVSHAEVLQMMDRAIAQAGGER